jgi:hypothetical protein
MQAASLDRQFGLAMDELIGGGLDFDRVAGETLREVFGDSPYEVFLSRSSSAKQPPSEFLRSLIAVFPDSVVGTLIVLIARRAMASLASAGHASSYPEYELLINKLQELPQSQSEGAKRRLLHDHREEDELDRLVGHKTD